MTIADVNQSLQYITYGLYILTVADGEQKNGMILNTVFQVTADPARVAISVNKQSLTHEILLRTKHFAAMPLAQTATLPFIGRFGFRTGRNFDKFAGVSFTTEASGCPVVREHTLSFVEADVTQLLDVETHTLFVADVTNAGIICPDATPLTYAYYHHVIKGKVPSGATHKF